MKINSSHLIYILAILTALIYNSWPLGYVLNPKLAGIGLASNLGSVNQPYNWLFTGGDVVCFFLVLAIAVLVYQKKRPVVLSLVGLLTFGLMTAVSALIPLNCLANPRACGYRQVFGWHNLTGALSFFGLFLAMVYAMQLLANHRYKRHYAITLVVWSVIGLMFCLSAIPAINRLLDITTIAVIWQDVFLILSGILVVLISYSYLNCRRPGKAPVDQSHPLKP